MQIKIIIIIERLLLIEHIESKQIHSVIINIKEEVEEKGDY
jgi:hypothetical protein